MRRELERHGYTVLEAADGEAALRLASEHGGSVRLLVTDVVMPQMSGPDLAQRLGHAHSELKVLYVSGYADDAVVRQGSLDPPGPLLQKPFEVGDLAARVRKLLDSPKASAIPPGSGRTAAPGRDGSPGPER